MQTHHFRLAHALLKSMIFLRLLGNNPFAILGKRSLVPTEMPRKMRTFLKDEHHTVTFKALIWNDLIHNFFEYISLSQRREYIKIVQIPFIYIEKENCMGHARTNHIQRNKDITHSPKSGKERLTKTDTLIQRGQNNV